MKEVRIDEQIITPECRKMWLDDGAWNEACCRLAEHYERVIDEWKDQPVQPTFILKLFYIRPDMPKSSNPPESPENKKR